MPRSTLVFLLYSYLVLVAPASGQEQSVRLPTDEELARQLRPIPPKTPEDELAAMEFSDGLTVELVASEPEVVDPIDIAFDQAGNLYVVEMHDYPFEAERPEDMGRIRLLQDRDGDGRFETSYVFAEGLHWPTSVHPWRDGVLVVAPPEMLYLADRDGDYRAEVRQVVLRGFGTRNVQALANNLTWSIEGRFYLANGGNGAELHARSLFRAPLRLSLGRSDLRFLPPDVLERVTGGGQFGHTVDDFGRRFVCNNSDHARFIVLDEGYLARNPYLRVTRTIDSIAVEGASAVVYRISPPEPWRVIRTRLRVAGLVPGPVEHGGKAAGYFTSATGITVYRGDALPTVYRGCLFVGDVAGNLVHRKVVEPHGASFRARRAEKGHEFLACKDLWFRPVNFANGPDGALYICDMYREIVEHPASIPDFMKKHLNLKSGSDRGRIWRVRARSAPRPQPVRLDQASELQLVAALDHPRGWVRDTAQRLLIEKSKLSSAALTHLRALATQARRPQTRAVALWTLETLNRQGADTSLLKSALKDSSPAVREQAVRILLHHLDTPETVELLLIAARDPAPRVRLYAAYGLGEIPCEQAARALLELLTDPSNDAWIRTAALSSCSPTKRLDSQRRGDEPKSMCYAVLAALVQSRRGTTSQERAVAAQLAEMLVLAKRYREFAKAFTAATRNGTGWRTTLAVAAADAAARRGSSLAKVLETADPSAVRLWNELVEGAAAAIRRGKASPDTISLLTHAPTDVLSEALPHLFAPQTPPGLLQQFIQRCAALRRDTWYAPVLNRWAGLTPSVRRSLAEALLSRDAGAVALLRAIESGTVRPADIDPDVGNRLRNHRNPKVRSLARSLLGTVRATERERQKLIEDYIANGALQAGDPTRGAKLYQENCEKCHGQPGKPGRIGPDLNTVRSRDARDIVTAILAPNAEVAPQYLSYTFALSDGRILTGMIVEETTTAITIGKADGTTETVLRSDIEQIRSSGQSLMPTGFEQQLTPRDIADLIAFLRSSPEPEADSN